MALLREDGHPKLIIEMKRWMSTEGKTELPGIREDIEKLQGIKACNGLLLVISSNPAKSSIQSNLKFLADHLEKRSEEFLLGQFPTYSAQGVEHILVGGA